MVLATDMFYHGSNMQIFANIIDKTQLDDQENIGNN